MVVSQAYDVPLPGAEDFNTDDDQEIGIGSLHPDLKEALGLLDSFLTTESSVDTADSNEAFQRKDQTLNPRNQGWLASRQDSIYDHGRCALEIPKGRKNRQF